MIRPRFVVAIILTYIVTLGYFNAEAFFVACMSGSGATCSLSAGSEMDSAGTGHQLGNNTSNFYYGAIVNNTYDACKFGFHLDNITGSMAGKTLYMSAWTVTGTPGSEDLNTWSRTLKTIDASTLNSGAWNTINVTRQPNKGHAWIATFNSTSSANFLRLSTSSTTTSAFGAPTRWSISGDNTSDLDSQDPSLRVYE